MVATKWARMLTTKNHESFDDPPLTYHPLVESSQRRRPHLLRQSPEQLLRLQVLLALQIFHRIYSLSVVIAPSLPKASAIPVPPAALGISPGKVTELRMKNSVNYVSYRNYWSRIYLPSKNLLNKNNLFSVLFANSSIKTFELCSRNIAHGNV